MTTRNKSQAKGRRDEQSRKMLEDRRRELLREVQSKMREARSDGAKEHEVLDQAEISDIFIQEDIEFALIQMKAETLSRIDAALRRLDEGTYGDCFDCGEEIATARLHALPFAVRCRECEEASETSAQRDRILTQRRDSSTPFSTLSVDV